MWDDRFLYVHHTGAIYIKCVFYGCVGLCVGLVWMCVHFVIWPWARGLWISEFQEWEFYKVSGFPGKVFDINTIHPQNQWEKSELTEINFTYSTKHGGVKELYYI